MESLGTLTSAALIFWRPPQAPKQQISEIFLGMEAGGNELGKRGRGKRRTPLVGSLLA
jgi:hypothetical protein